MQLVVQVRIHPDNLIDGDDAGELIDIATIHRDGPVSSSTVGLSIVEAKQVLAGLEDVVVAEQAAHAIAAASECVECGRPFAAKDSRTIVMRSR